MTRRTIRAWHLVHRWSSIVCTAFLLMLCLTGLPLIFHSEIAALSTPPPPAIVAQPGVPLRSLDSLVAAALASRPGEICLSLGFDADQPIVSITTGASATVSGNQMTTRSYSRVTGALVRTFSGGRGGVMAFLFQMHVDMFMGQSGMLILGAMGLLFLVALVSGTVLYAPFMRRLNFGTLRHSGAARRRWRDYHNLFGIALLAWAGSVALTGVTNTLATPLVRLWQANDLAEMTAGKAQARPPGRLGSIDAALTTAQHAAPGMRPQYIAFPGSPFGSTQDYAVFLEGATPLTRRLLTPALIDAETGALTAIRPLPWYMQAVLIVQPLHFGDYGGLPLKILWAILDLGTMLVLVSGLYLWLGKRRARPRGDTA